MAEDVGIAAGGAAALLVVGEVLDEAESPLRAVRGREVEDGDGSVVIVLDEGLDEFTQADGALDGGALGEFVDEHADSPTPALDNGHLAGVQHFVRLIDNGLSVFRARGESAPWDA